MANQIYLNLLDEFYFHNDNILNVFPRSNNNYIKENSFKNTYTNILYYLNILLI